MAAKKQQLTIEEIEKNLKVSKQEIEELIKYGNDPIIGVDYEKMQAFITNHRWAINPDGHIKSIRDQMKTLFKNYMTLINNVKNQLDIINIQDKLDELAKKILTLGLIDFDYDKEADDPEVGPVNLKLLCQEISYFLVVEGGITGSKHSKMLQRLAQINQSTD